MTYEDWSYFAQTWGTLYFVAIFAAALESKGCGAGESPGCP